MRDVSVYCMSICEDKKHISGIVDGTSVSSAVRLREV